MLGIALKLHLLLLLDSGKVYPVTLKSANPMSFSSQRSKIEFLKTVFANFVKLTSIELVYVFLRLLDLEVDLRAL